MPWKADTEAYLCFYSSCPTLVFYRLEKVFYSLEAVLLFLHECGIKLIPSRHQIPAGSYEIAWLIQIDLAKFIRESTDHEADILVKVVKHR